MSETKAEEHDCVHWTAASPEEPMHCAECGKPFELRCVEAERDALAERVKELEGKYRDAAKMARHNYRCAVREQVRHEDPSIEPGYPELPEGDEYAALVAENENLRAALKSAGLG